MEKVILSPEHALKAYKELADKHISSMKQICEELSSAANQISMATEGEMIPNLTSALVAALADSIHFADRIVRGQENLIARPPRPEVPVECKAVISEDGNTVSILVPSFSDEKVLGEWISNELISSLSTLWGESKLRVSVRGVVKSDEDPSEDCIGGIAFQLDKGEDVLVKANSLITLKKLDNADWIKVIPM